MKNNISFDVYSKYDNPYIADAILSHLDNIGISYNSSNVQYGLALFFSDTIDITGYTNLESVLYYETGTANQAILYSKNTSGNFVQESDFPLQTNMISSYDMNIIDTVYNFNSENILLLMDESNFPIVNNPSVLQAFLDNKYDDDVYDPNDIDPEPYTRYCNSNPDCEEESEGYCTYVEHQAAPTDPICGTMCATVEIIANNDEGPLDIADDVAPMVRGLRNSFFTSNQPRRKFIDDYYYVSSVISTSINLQLCTDFYNLSNTNFFDILSNYDNSIYQDSIPINSVTKPILLSLCNETKSISTDTRTDAIMDTTISRINNYEGKTMSYINSNF